MAEGFRETQIVLVLSEDEADLLVTLLSVHEVGVDESVDAILDALAAAGVEEDNLSTNYETGSDPSDEDDYISGDY
jgi:hypothetical protein